MPKVIHTGYLNVRGDDGEYIKTLTVAEKSIIPEPPTANGVYVLTVTVANGVATYSWTTK